MKLALRTINISIFNKNVKTIQQKNKKKLAILYKYKIASLNYKNFDFFIRQFLSKYLLTK